MAIILSASGFPGTITIGTAIPVGSGEANTASNVGAGAGVFRDKVGANLNLRSITGSNGVVVTENADEIDIAGPASLGDFSGPAGATANVPVVFADASGKLGKEPDAALDFLGQDASNIGLVDGRDVSADGSTLDTHIGDVANPHATTAAQVGADPTGTAASAVAAHEAAPDPHPQYTTTAEAAAAAPVQSVNAQTGAVVLGAADVGADPSGTAASAVAAHEAAPDPHPQYTTVAEAAAAAPVQSVNGNTGAVALTAGDVGADPAGTAAAAVASHEVAFDHTNIPTGNQKAALDAANAPSGGNPVATIADLPTAGDVTGPAGATANAPAQYDGATGKVLKDPDTAFDFAGQDITNVGLVDGRDVSSDAAANNAHIANTSNPHSTTAAQLGAVELIEKGAANGVAELNALVQVPDAQLPPLAITNTFNVPDQASRLALPATIGDIAVQTDIPATFVLRTTPPTMVGSWEEILASASGSVTSVNGDTGPAVVLDSGDIPEGANLYYTEPRVSANVDVVANTAHRNTITGNPHQLDVGDLIASDLATLNSKVTDATLDDAGDPRTPTGAAGGDLAGTYPNPTVVAATETAAGKIEIATQAEVDAGTVPDKAVTPLTLANTPMVAVHDFGGADHAPDTLANVNSKIIDANLDDAGDPRVPTGAAGGDLTGTYPNPGVVQSSDSVAGKIEIATQGEADTGTDGTRAITPATLSGIPRLPTQDENDALVGTGTPSAANPYVNDDDSRLTDSRTPTGAAGGGLGGTYPNPSVDGMTGGVLTDDTAHGSRGGGSTHAEVVAAGSSGFMSGTDKSKLDGIENGATADQTITAGTGLSGGGTGDVSLSVDYGTTSGTATEGSDSRVPTQDENDALVGTDGTPSAANPFVTDSDARNTNPRTPTGAAGGGLNGTYPNPGVNGMTAGSLTDDAAHGNRGGGALHADVVAAGASGFMTGADKSKLDGFGTVQQATATGIVNVTSATPILLSGMTITPGVAGDYLVWFSTTAQGGANGADWNFQLYVGGVAVAHTLRTGQGQREYGYAINAYVTGVGAADAIEIQVAQPGGGSVDVADRTLTVWRVA